PEQAEDPRKADIRSDIYSLGCCLFYLLTSKPPFDGTDAVARIGARVLGEAPLLRSYRSDAPAALEQLLATLLARDPAKRPQTPKAVAARLEPFCIEQPKPLIARAVPVTPIAPMVTSRTGWGRGVLVLSGVLTVAIASVLIWSMLRTKNARDEADRKPD